MKLLTYVLIAAAALGIGWAYVFGPYHIDAWKMQDVVGTTALTWQELGEAKAHQELGVQLRRREIPEYLTPESCTFYEDAGQMKVVDCDWYVDVYPPMLEPRRLKFRVIKAAGPGGVLEDR